ncbi:hypothetical protein [Candidatus Amarolinea dominans]|uniref:hypothetical protein n=1 Tax=Candidatus Amarolinea dominans TaxID=3140696 RepID=UPI003134F57B|nr:hypothetical protein [Anaerolineae bacterium]
MEYAKTIKDVLEVGRAALRREAPLLMGAGIIPRTALREFAPDLLKGIEIPTTQDPAAACGGAQTPHPTLVADAALMHDLYARLSAIKPPDQLADWLHKPLLNGIGQWGNALDKINTSCATADTAERERLRREAGLELGKAYVNYMVATVAAIQILIWTGLIDAGEAVLEKRCLERCLRRLPAEPDIYHPNAELAGAALANANLSHCLLVNANLQ